MVPQAARGGPGGLLQSGFPLQENRRLCLGLDRRSWLKLEKPWRVGSMATVPVDSTRVAQCRALAGNIADDVQRYIDAHTTSGVERTILRAYGADGVDDQGAPLVNTAVDRYREAGLLDRGIAFFLGRALMAGAASPQDAAERLAFASAIDDGSG